MRFTLDINHKKKRNKHKKSLSMFTAGIFPVLAAIFKCFTYSFGAMNFINFFYLGSITLTAAAFSGPFFPLVCILGVSIIFITLGMEGKSFYKTLRTKLDSLLGVENTEETKTNLNNPVIISSAQKTFYQFVAGCSRFGGGLVIPFLAACTKGSASTIATIGLLFGCFSLAKGLAITGLGIGTVLALGPPGIAILAIGIIAGISITAISLGKEGRAFYKLTEKFSSWLTNTPTEQKLPKYPSSVKFNTPHPKQQKMVAINNRQPAINGELSNFEKWQACKTSYLYPRSTQSALGHLWVSNRHCNKIAETVMPNASPHHKPKTP